MEDDIQYLGTRVGVVGPQISLVIPDHPFPSPQRPVTGIVLHVEKAGEQPAYGMVFRKAVTSVVNIGRRPASGPDKGDESNESGRAMFRCPVISRKHAKIAFADSGQVYLIDLNSHHGTHILKPGDIVSKMLKSETPTMLADGDVVTFGKTVGKDHHFVSPVVVRIELLFGTSAATTPPSIVVPCSVDETTLVSSPAGSSESSKISSRTNSGRYGVYVPSSSDDSSSKSDHDSDVEEVEAPPPVSHPTSSDHDGGNTSTHVGRALEVLKRLMPPVHTPIVHCDPQCSALYFPRSPSPEYYPRSPSPFSRRTPRSPLLPYFNSPINEPVSPRYSPVGFDAYSNDVFEEQDRSKSTSPMDLSSPSPEPSDKQVPEPVVVGAWPASRSSSPAHNKPVRSSVVDEATTQAIAPPTMSSEDRESSLQSTSGVSVEAVYSESRLPTKSPVAENVTHETSDPFPQTPISDSGMRDDITELKTSLESVRGELSKLQVHRRKYKARFNANVHTIAEKLTDLDDRVTDLKSMSHLVDDVTHVDIPDLQSQVEALQEQMDAVTRVPDLPAPETEVLVDREDVKASIGALNDLVNEMRSLRVKMQNQIAVELKEVTAARIEALAAIRAEVETHRFTPLKRKADHDESYDNVGKIICIDEGSEGIEHPFTTFVAIPDTLAAPPAKRARRIVSTVAQTATAVTIGAVVTWSALAFS